MSKLHEKLTKQFGRPPTEIELRDAKAERKRKKAAEAAASEAATSPGAEGSAAAAPASAPPVAPAAQPPFVVLIFSTLPSQSFRPLASCGPLWTPQVCLLNWAPPWDAFQSGLRVALLASFREFRKLTLTQTQFEAEDRLVSAASVCACAFVGGLKGGN